MISYWSEHAWLPEGVAESVRLDVSGDRITAVTAGAARTGTILNGLTVPGLANTHSHAFHRALRGRTSRERGTFWTWREQMYELAAKLQPDSYFRLARAVFAEMVLAGFTAVGEFHYLHHAPGGKPYAQPNAMADAVIAAAAEAGIRITLLDTCYLAGGIGRQLSPVQQRFSDSDAEGWAARVDDLCAGDAVVGAAVHSVRAVPAAQLPVIADWARRHDSPLHVHVSEQRQENQDCLDHYGRTPTALLADGGALGTRTVAIHATHLSGEDIALMAGSGSRVSFCPTTERDLADGIGPAARLRDAGVSICLGSDSHAVIDPFEEMRALEADERLASEQRGHFTEAELLAVGTDHAALGRPGVGKIAVGALADMVTLDTASIRTAGVPAKGVPLAASSADIHDVLVGGRQLVRGRQHTSLGDVGRLLEKEIGELWA
ncbi:MAG: formimidoylglutamate deiminase [Sciscionella sp.]